MKKQSNLGYQIFAFIIAIVLWMFVGMGSRFEMGKRTISMPIALKNAPRALSLDTKPGEATLIIEGPKKALDSLTQENFAVFVDLAHGWNGELDVNVTSPPGIKPASIEPQKVRVIINKP